MMQLLDFGGTNNFDIKDQSYDEVRKKLRYTWFNMNPVHVLKSSYCPEELGKASMDTAITVPFEYGKEYLQIFSDRRDSADPNFVRTNSGRIVAADKADGTFFGNLFLCAPNKQPARTISTPSSKSKSPREK